MIDRLIPRGNCLHCDEAKADINPWICGGCSVSIRRDTVADKQLGDYPLTTLFRYDGAVQTLLTRAKHPLEPAIYSELLKVDFDLPQNAYFIPVPTPWHRRFKRRGCQTSCIAEELARRFDGQVFHALRRVSHYRPQAKLNAAQRAQLPARSFRCIKPPPNPPLIVVDDIITTGSTLSRAADALAVDSAHIRLFALARVP